MALLPTLRIVSSTGGAAVTNTTTETDLFAMTLPAGVLPRTGWAVQGRTHGVAVASSSGTLTLRLRSRVGASTALLMDAAVVLSTSVDDRRWQVDFSGILPSTAAQTYRTAMRMGVPSTSLLDASTADLFGGSTAGQSGTGAVTYAVTAQWDRASTALSVDGLGATLDLSR